ncbi:DUF1566 domain-containing protein [Leptospira sp. 201903070]|uniref:DUF1566 domain-containing protein n=1 Tax=Leptospira ainlahdjerensis TaxID=2810033 RepID=A0ABS2U6P2_9LEPT|nr:DUF1566 domain-containing protein [Leptospira ainlahdjerensis]MBM9575799.1 DUF1566 domain-containing protein [Leptospira ainlahdjerensis]
MDTGQNQCWTPGGVITACLGTGQDGEFTNTPRPRSFGSPTQHCRYTNDYTTLDQIHGLTWRTCAQGRANADCSGGTNTLISWDDANAGLPGSCSELNTLHGGNGYAGKTNWRVPTIRELFSLIHVSNIPKINTVSFPNTNFASSYLSDSSYVPVPTLNFVSLFNNTAIPTTLLPKNTNQFLRCVSGNQIPAFSFVDNGDETITDQNSRLLWQKCVGGISGALCTVNPPINFDWANSLAYCNGLNFAGRTDWRLPNTNELLSIADFTVAIPPAIVPVFFPNTPIAQLYWTSTTYQTIPSFAFAIDFTNARAYATNKALALPFTRCVTDAP